MIDINWKPTERQLRQFAALFFVFSLLGGWVLGPKLGQPWPLIFWTVGPAVLLIGLLLPRVVRPLYLGLTLLAFPIGFVISYIVMGFVFYGLMTAIALWFRLIRRDPLQRRFEPEADSYWIKRPTGIPVDRYFRQF